MRAINLVLRQRIQNAEGDLIIPANNGRGALGTGLQLCPALDSSLGCKGSMNHRARIEGNMVLFQRLDESLFPLPGIANARRTVDQGQTSMAQFQKADGYVVGGQQIVDADRTDVNLREIDMRREAATHDDDWPGQVFQFDELPDGEWFG